MTFPHGRRGAQDTSSQEEPKEILCVSYSGAIGRVLCGRVTQKPDSAQDAHHCKSVSPKYVKKIRYDQRSTLDASANSLIILRRLAISAVSPSTADARSEDPVLGWASEYCLGYQKEWAQAVEQRRAHALSILNARKRHIYRVELTADWRFVTGLGEQTGDHEFGLSLHGTYGWPLIPASTLKGAAAAWASRQKVPSELYTLVFGPLPSPEDEEDRDNPRCGVRFFDALPLSDPRNHRKGLRVHSDVITPHQHAYHTDQSAEPCAPGEHHQPVPLPFLSLSGTFVTHLIGEDPDLTAKAADWLKQACEEYGIGARTTAGYGYFTVNITDQWDSP